MSEITRLRFGRNAFAGVGAIRKAAWIISVSDLLGMAGRRKTLSATADQGQETRTARKIDVSNRFGLFGASVSEHFKSREKQRNTRIYTNFVLYLASNTENFSSVQ